MFFSDDTSIKSADKLQGSFHPTWESVDMSSLRVGIPVRPPGNYEKKKNEGNVSIQLEMEDVLGILRKMLAFLPEEPLC